MRKFHLTFLIPALLAVPVSSAAGELKLSIRNGLVTLIAEDVPLSMIMAEWARLGQTQIVNCDKISTPVTLQNVDMPQRRAIDILLRPVSGYMVAERPAVMVDASVFDRIMILPTSRPPANTGPISAPPAMFNRQPVPVQPPVPDVDDEAPVPNTLPQPGQLPGPQPTVPGMQNPSVPNAPLTAPRPGQLPAPTPQQPVPFGTPTKPGGGGPPGGSGGGR
jgi:hypothetical protein